MKTKNILIIIIFISFIYIPTILYYFISDKMDNNNYVNRTLYEKPTITLDNIPNIPNNFTNYYNDHIPFKNELMKLRSSMLYKFNISSNDGVVLGKDGWMFFNSKNINDADSIGDYQKTTSFTEEEINSICDKLVKVNNYFNDKNISFALFLPPNKSTVYSDYLKDYIPRNDSNNSKTEELINAIKNDTNINIIDPKDKLISERNKLDTYLKYDTHWNEYGSYIGFTELMYGIEPNYQSKDISIEYASKNGDLAYMDVLPKLRNNEPVIKGFYDDTNYTCEDDFEYKKCQSDNPIYDKTLLLVGDSFKTALIPYIAKSYKNTIFVTTNTYSEDLLINNNPDIVVYEVVERASVSLKWIDIYLDLKKDSN